MQRDANVGSWVLGRANRDIRFRLVRHYGSPEATEEAVNQLAENPKLLEAWATDVSGEVFRFSGLPGSMREAGVVTMAMAMLEHRIRVERGAA